MNVLSCAFLAVVAPSTGLVFTAAPRLEALFAGDSRYPVFRNGAYAERSGLDSLRPHATRQLSAWRPLKIV
jgi:hypothetical protein